MDPLTWFENKISTSRQKYSSVRMSMARTDDALYEALASVYVPYLKMYTHHQARDAFHSMLKAHKMRKGRNEALTLVELGFFPHVLLRRKKNDHYNHKADIDKASSYAKVISYARAHKVKPKDLIKFIRDKGGIQAIAKAETERCPRRTEQAGIRLGKARPTAATGSSAAAVRAPRPGHRLLPLTLWCTHEMATRIIEKTDDAYYGSSDRFMIRGQWHDTHNAIVTGFDIAPKHTVAKPPIRPMAVQSTGNVSPTRLRGSGPVTNGKRPPLSKRMPNQPLGKRPTSVGTTPSGKTPSGKTPWQ